MNQQAHIAPRLVISLGVFRSASTWVYNVSSNILEKQHTVQKIYTDHMSEFVAMTEGNYDALVVKMHNPDQALQSLIRFSSPRIIVTMRDPLDCVASLMRQFFVPFDDAQKLVANSAGAVLNVLKINSPLILRYEDPVGRNGSVVESIAKHLGMDLSSEDAARIADQFSAQNVKRFIDSLSETKYFDDRGPTEQVHSETQWHPRHVGEGRTGSFSSVLTEQQIASVAEATAEFSERFSYR